MCFPKSKCSKAGWGGADDRVKAVDLVLFEDGHCFPLSCTERKEGRAQRKLEINNFVSLTDFGQRWPVF